MENESLVNQIQNDIDVQNNVFLLYDNNLPLIRQWIKPYCQGNYDLFEDILQEVYFCVEESARKFDFSRGVKYITFLKFYVTKTAQLYLAKSGAITIPSHYRQKIYQYKVAFEELQQKHNRPPTLEELADYLQESIEEIQLLDYWSYGTASLDTPLQTSNDDITSMMELLPDTNAYFEDDVLTEIEREEQKAIWKTVETYTTERQNHIIKMHFLEGKTLEEIACSMDITRERVRQIESVGFSRLRLEQPRKELLEKYEELDAQIYNSSVTSYKRHCETSIVERVALSKLEHERYFMNRIGKAI